MGDHTTVDDASRYRSDEEVAKWQSKEPITRLRTYLETNHDWSKADETALLANCQQQIDDAATDYLATPAQSPEAMFDFLYANLPTGLETQRQHLRNTTQPDNDV